SRTVTLAVAVTVDPFGGGTVALTVNNVQSQDKTLTFSGQATFAGDRVVSSSLNQNQTTALRTSEQLFYQLTDPNGVARSIESTLIRDSIPLTPAQVESIQKWIFEGKVGEPSIYQFIADRAAWNTAVAAPPGSVTLSFAVDPANVNREQVFLLSVSFVVRRTGGAVLGDLQTIPGVTRAATEIAPRFAKVSPDEEDKTVGLVQFASSFQTALSVEGSYRLKVATGVDRRSVTSARNGSVLWVVRVGLRQGAEEPISYRIDDKKKPVIFAPQPISNQLQTHSNVEIRTFETGKGLIGPKLHIDF